MGYLAINSFLIAFLVQCGFGGVPLTVKWLFGCPSGIDSSYCLEVDFHDNQETDIAVLYPKYRKKDCIYEGKFINESTVDVVITSMDCPISELSKIDVSFASSRSSHLFFTMDPKQSRAVPFVSKNSNKDIMLFPPKKVGSFQTKKPAKWNFQPQGHQLSIIALYDRNFQKRFKRKAKTRIQAVLAQAQTFFNLKSSLGTTIKLNLITIRAFRGKSFPATEGRLELLGSKILKWKSKRLQSANAYALFSSENDEPGTIGIGYVGSVCLGNNERNYRTSISEYFVNDLETAQVVAHEIGHNLGMSHDFNGNNPRYCKTTGETCTDINGIMDYNQDQVDKWSCCSRVDFQEYAQLFSQAQFCLKPVA